MLSAININCEQIWVKELLQMTVVFFFVHAKISRQVRTGAVKNDISSRSFY